MPEGWRRAHGGRGESTLALAGAVARGDSVYTTRPAHVPSQTAPGSAPRAGCPHRPALPRGAPASWGASDTGGRSEAQELAAGPAEHLTQVNSCFL